MKYFLVETDRAKDCAEVIDTFTDKQEAIKSRNDKRQHKSAVNQIRISEGSKERNTNFYYVSNSDKFTGEFDHLPEENIIEY